MSRIEHPNWEQVWLAEAIRIAEETGPLDDTQALARVQRLPMPERDKLLERAWQLGQRLGWTAQLEHLRDAGWWLLLLWPAAWWPWPTACCFQCWPMGAASTLPVALCLRWVFMH